MAGPVIGTSGRPARSAAVGAVPVPQRSARPQGHADTTTYHDQMDTTQAESALEQHNEAVRARVIARRDEVLARHRERMQAGSGADPLAALTGELRATVRSACGVPEDEIVVDLVERDRHGADLAFKFPGLLRNGGPRRFAAEHAPAIRAALEAERLTAAVESVDTVGMYVNVRLRDEWLLSAAESVVAAGAAFGRSTSLAHERLVVDYSSPNVAKSLHAGHIRSTIIGTVLSNVLDEAGATVFRVNHINDFGGFGFLLEGHRRFADRFGAEAGLDDRSLDLYRLRRVLEQAGADGTVADLAPPDADLVRRLLPDVRDNQPLGPVAAELTEAADRRFAALERGEPGEVALWDRIVQASLESFSSFYEALGVSIDFVIGESFYAAEGLAMVEEWLRSGQAVRYGEAEAAEDRRRLRQAFEAEEISEQELQSLEQAVAKDTGAVVVRVGPTERYVVLRADGRSIYATRDLAAVAVRRQLFDPTGALYVVGQEQKTHFERLFAASYVLGLADPDRTTFEHIYFGFYVDAHTHRKLSSRESASGVIHLLEAAQAHFRSRVGDSRAPGRQDPETVARQLTVASIVFNDLKQDTRSTVEIDTTDFGSMVETFDRSGGAYVIYTTCRAGSIVTKATGAIAGGALAAPEPLEHDEVRILLHLLNFPAAVRSAAASRNPSILVRHMFHLSNLYNSYNARARVIGDTGVVSSRLSVTAAVERVLRNGLALCSVDCPDYI